MEQGKPCIFAHKLTQPRAGPHPITHSPTCARTTLYIADFSTAAVAAWCVALRSCVRVCRHKSRVSEGYFSMSTVGIGDAGRGEKVAMVRRGREERVRVGAATSSVHSGLLLRLVAMKATKGRPVHHQRG